MCPRLWHKLPWNALAKFKVDTFCRDMAQCDPMPQAPRIYISLSPACQKMLDDLVGGRMSPFKRSTVASFALEYGLRAVAGCPTAVPMQMFQVSNG